MKVGLLWYDNDRRRSLEAKIQEAVQRYYERFGIRPNACYVHPSSLETEKVQIGEVWVIKARNILPDHFWLGITEL